MPHPYAYPEKSNSQIIGLSDCRYRAIRRGRLRCFGAGSLDIGLRIAVDYSLSCSRRVLGHELAVLVSECLAKANGCMATKIGESFAFLFAHVLVIGFPGTSDCRPPLVGADRCRIGVPNAGTMSL